MRTVLGMCTLPPRARSTHCELDQRSFAANRLLVGGPRLRQARQTRADWRADRRPLASVGAARLLAHALADRIYDAVAANRYRLFGRRKRCMMPPREWRARLLG
jgi:predicted DCC family thiol-disulfide oxidoreductase YuxK